MSAHTLALNSEALKRLQVKETVLLLGGSVLLQFVVHLVPSYNNTPMGAILLAMFYAPLIAAIFFKPHVGIVTAALTPLVNYLLTGFPKPEQGAALTVELLVFVVAASFLLQKKNLKYLSALLALLGAKAASWIVFAVFPIFTALTSQFFVQSLINAIPGIFVILFLNIFLLRGKEKK